MKELGRKLKACRELTDVTQLDISALCNFSTTQYVSNVERGIGKPSPLLIKAYAYVTNTDISKLVTWMLEYEGRILLSKLKKIKLKGK